MNDPASAPSQPILLGSVVALEPLEARHAPELLEAAADGRLWELKVTVVPGPSSIDSYVAAALGAGSTGRAWPFVIRRRSDGKIVGSTRYWKIDRQHRKLEIGHTWISASVQRSAVNTECKLLLLSHAFEVLGCVRVQFTTDELNERSRAAIARLGAKQEGILRNERIMPDGRRRNSVRFSIIDSEWLEVKARLERKLAAGSESAAAASKLGPA